MCVFSVGKRVVTRAVCNIANMHQEQTKNPLCQSTEGISLSYCELINSCESRIRMQHLRNFNSIQGLVIFQNRCQDTWQC